MGKTFWGTVVAVALLAAPAVAADLPYKARPMPVVEVYNWTGCYIGVSGGGLWAHKRWTDDDPFNTTRGLDRESHTASGGMIGGQGGCDYQTGRWVFGVEGSYHASNATATTNDLLFPTTLTGTTDVSGLGTVTARFGYTVMEQALLYVRGGVAFERDRYSMAVVTGNVLLATAGETRTGGLIAVGFEYLLSKNLSAFIEYDYIDMGSRDVTFVSVTRGTPFQIDSIRERKDVVKVGVNWRFNMAQPVVAKY
jgi:outer membrane immunogenic protein